MVSPAICSAVDDGLADGVLQRLHIGDRALLHAFGQMMADADNARRLVISVRAIKQAILLEPIERGIFAWPDEVWRTASS